MRRRFLIISLVPLVLWGLGTVVAGLWVLPPMLLMVQGPRRVEADRAAARARIGETWERA
jgi:hypothetical protein